MIKYFATFVIISISAAFFLLKDPLSPPEVDRSHTDNDQEHVDHHAHDQSHSHSGSAQEPATEKQDKKSQKELSINDIEARLCTDDFDHHSCNIKLDIDLTEALIDKKSKAARVEEIGAVLQSKNFDEVMMSITGHSSENIMKSENFNMRARSIAEEYEGSIESNFSCNESLCLSKFRTDNNDDWKDFQQKFFTDEAAGNIFILPESESSNTMRAMLVFGKGAPVRRRED
ncbi:hypothetical protein [Microbulbifer mangrovi]|uniref:hypothetical protein n=1 Tax=Microbulbifer mangrovi TaxID=927787 RepID=UPI00117E1C9D|nr:hypothetical protein [Microbulbifer mangrovi]